MRKVDIGVDTPTVQDLDFDTTAREGSYYSVDTDCNGCPAASFAAVALAAEEVALERIYYYSDRRKRHRRHYQNSTACAAAGSGGSDPVHLDDYTALEVHGRTGFADLIGTTSWVWGWRARNTLRCWWSLSI